MHAHCHPHKYDTHTTHTHTHYNRVEICDMLGKTRPLCHTWTVYLDLTGCGDRSLSEATGSGAGSGRVQSTPLVDLLVGDELEEDSRVTGQGHGGEHCRQNMASLQQCDMEEIALLYW